MVVSVKTLNNYLLIIHIDTSNLGVVIVVFTCCNESSSFSPSNAIRHPKKFSPWFSCERYSYKTAQLILLAGDVSNGHSYSSGTFLECAQWILYNLNEPQVENVLFRLSIFGLIQQIGMFRDTLSLPRGAGNAGEGDSDSHPIVVPGITTEIFTFIINTLFGRYVRCCYILDHTIDTNMF